MGGITAIEPAILDKCCDTESTDIALKVGHSAPLGATVYSKGVNFSVFSRSASRIELLLFDHEDDARPSRFIPIDPFTNRTYHYWHVFVPGVRPGQIYAYRAYGPFDPSKGLRFDSDKALLERLEFELPRVDTGLPWNRWIDTALESPNDIVDWRSGSPVGGNIYPVEARSVVILVTRLEQN